MDEKETLFVIEMSTHAWDQSGYISNNFKPNHLSLYLYYIPRKQMQYRWKKFILRYNV